MASIDNIRATIRALADAGVDALKVVLGTPGTNIEYPDSSVYPGFGTRTQSVGGAWTAPSVIDTILQGISSDIDRVDGLVDALYQPFARVWCVGSETWMYSTIADAITAINADPTPPAACNRAMVLIFPGYYTMKTKITVPQWVQIKGVSKRMVQLYNNTTDMFRVSDNTWFSDFLIEGAPTTTIAAFDGNGASGVRIARVDMLRNGGNNKQRFIWQSGANWKTLLIEDCIIDWYGTGGYVNLLVNTSGAARAVDVMFNNVFFDAFQLTTWGHNIGVRACKDVRIRNSTIRGNGGWHTGVRVENRGIAGSVCHVRHSYLEGGVPVYGEANTHYNLINSDAIGALTAGTRTLRNSSV